MHTGPLAIILGRNSAMTIVLRETHQEQIRLFHEVAGVKKSLKNR